MFINAILKHYIHVGVGPGVFFLCKGRYRYNHNESMNQFFTFLNLSISILKLLLNFTKCTEINCFFNQTCFIVWNYNQTQLHVTPILWRFNTIACKAKKTHEIYSCVHTSKYNYHVIFPSNFSVFLALTILLIWLKKRDFLNNFFIVRNSR